MMSCPCGLTKEEVLEVAEKHGVPLIGGKCQNPLADGSDGVCGKALGAHPSSQGNFNYKTVLSFNYRSGTNMLLLVFLFRKRGGFTETDRGFTETSSRGYVVKRFFISLFLLDAKALVFKYCSWEQLFVYVFEPLEVFV
jgi:hypothetical protein